MFVNLIVVFIFTQLNVFQVIMSDFQSSEAILNDLFSSIESKYDTVHTNSENQTEDEDSDSTESSEEKVPEVSKLNFL